MNKLQEALKFFLLSIPFTEKELKKVYREFAKKWHPDLHNDDDEMMKKVNDYYEFLRKYLKGEVDEYGNLLNDETTRTGDSFDLDYYKKDLIEDFRNIVMSSILFRFDYSSLIINFENALSSKNSKLELELCYEEYKRKFYKKVVEIVNKLSNSNIQISEVDYILEYQLFCDSLNKKLKSYYDIKFDEILFKYKQYPNYDILSKRIILSISEARKSFENEFSSNGMKSISSYSNLMSDLDGKITDMFDEYFKYLNELNSLLEKTNDNEIKEEITNFITKFNSVVDFDEAKRFISDIKAKVPKNAKNKLSIMEQILSTYKGKIDLSKVVGQNRLNKTDGVCLDEFKNYIFNACDLVHNDDYILLYKDGFIVGVYFPCTDTLNIVLESPYEIKFLLIMSSKFNIMDDGKYQEADAAWFKDFCSCPYDLCCSNMFLDLRFIKCFEKSYIDSLGTCELDSSISDTLKINIFDFEISFEYSRKSFNPNFNTDMAILNRHGELKEDKGGFHNWLRRKFCYYYSTDSDDLIPFALRDYIDNKSYYTNHYDLLKMRISKIKPRLHKHKSL